MVIFSFVLGACFYSAYQLIYENQNFGLDLRKRSQATTDREPSNVSQKFETLQSNCKKAESFPNVESASVRFKGKNCGIKANRIEVLNEANAYRASVFVNTNGGDFSTEYIPLTSGRNRIQMSFYSDQHLVFEKELAVDHR